MSMQVKVPRGLFKIRQEAATQEVVMPGCKCEVCKLLSQMPSGFGLYFSSDKNKRRRYVVMDKDCFAATWGATPAEALENAMLNNWDTSTPLD